MTLVNGRFTPGRTPDATFKKRQRIARIRRAHMKMQRKLARQINRENAVMKPLNRTSPTKLDFFDD